MMAIGNDFGYKNALQNGNWDFPVDMKPVVVKNGDEPCICDESKNASDISPRWEPRGEPCGEHCEPDHTDEKDAPVRSDRLVIYDMWSKRKFGVVSPYYRLIPHRLVFEQLMELASDLFGTRNGSDTPPITINSHKGGEVVSFYLPLRRFPVFLFPSKGDMVEVGIRVTNSYDGKHALKIQIAGIRVLCGNGMVGAFDVRSGMKKHIHRCSSDSPPSLLELRRTLREMLRSMVMRQEMFEETVKRSVDFNYNGRQLKVLFDNISLPGEYKKIAFTELIKDGPVPDVPQDQKKGDQPVKGKTKKLLDILDMTDEFLDKLDVTAWQAYNAFTWAITHNYESKSPILKNRYEAEAYRVLIPSSFDFVELSRSS